MKTTLQRRGTSGHSLLRSVLLFCAAFWLGLAASQAGQAGIDDHAAFFSETARSQASRTIAEIKRQFHEDLFIETFNTLPDSVKQGVNLQDKAALNKAIEKWTVEDAKKRAVTGVYVLIVKDPPHLQAVVGNQTARQAFTVQDRDSLARIMLNKLHAKQNDEALADGANFVFSTMKSHLPNRPAASNNSGYRTSQTNQGSGHGFLWLIVGVIGLWLVVSIFRSLFGAGRGMAQGPMAGGMPPPMPGGYPPGSYPPASSGGGGFMRSMLGGMFGSAAGMWMYDRFFGGHSSSGWGDGGGSNYGGGGGGFSGGGDSGYSNQDTDYSGSGGSFGDDYGSNNGGGGGGGGDWGGGGGDSGGGGGDSGGGGGDF